MQSIHKKTTVWFFCPLENKFKVGWSSETIPKTHKLFVLRKLPLLRIEPHSSLLFNFPELFSPTQGDSNYYVWAACSVTFICQPIARAPCAIIKRRPTSPFLSYRRCTADIQAGRLHLLWGCGRQTSKTKCVIHLYGQRSRGLITFVSQKIYCNERFYRQVIL